MGPTSRWVTMAVAALVLACAGCSALLPKLETPRLSLVSLKMQDMNFFEQRLLVRLRVQNPNDIALPVKGINVNFELSAVGQGGGNTMVVANGTAVEIRPIKNYVPTGAVGNILADIADTLHGSPQVR